MDKRLEQIKAAALEKLSGLKEEQELSDLQQQLFGKSGELTAILRTMGQISKEERSRMGAEVNKTKAELAAAMEEKKEAFRRKAQELKFKREALDVTEPGIMPSRWEACTP